MQKYTSIEQEINDYLQSRDETSYGFEDANVAPLHYMIDQSYTKPSRNNKKKIKNRNLNMTNIVMIFK